MVAVDLPHPLDVHSDVLPPLRGLLVLQEAVHDARRALVQILPCKLELKRTRLSVPSEVFSPGFTSHAVSLSLWGGKACIFIRKHDHFTPTRKIKRHVRALARHHPEGSREGSGSGVERLGCKFRSRVEVEG